MLVSISWAFWPQRGDRGPTLSGDAGGPSISHWSLRDFLCERNREEEVEVITAAYTLFKLMSYQQFTLKGIAAHWFLELLVYSHQWTNMTRMPGLCLRSQKWQMTLLFLKCKLLNINLVYLAVLVMLLNCGMVWIFSRHHKIQIHVHIPIFMHILKYYIKKTYCMEK